MTCDQQLLTHENLAALAVRHGFDDVKVTGAAPHREAARLFREWVDQGRHADMAWLLKDSERRGAPLQHIRDACSVITLAVNYYREAAEPVPAGHGRVARYAAGVDYHKAIDRQLKAMIRELVTYDPNRLYRYYVDYGPVLERGFAERAGLGFVGKSACLIHPRLGTYVFLATLITNAPFAPTLPAPGTCGQCRRCIDVCPTGALVGPGQVDARLCISYLTIENKGPIPRHLRPLIGNWIFGCDLCQEVCPYNAKAERGKHPRIVGMTVAGTELDVAEVLGLRTQEAFAVRFMRSPFHRAKREGLLRNAAVVAGNLGRRELVPVLCEALEDSSALVRGHVVWALGRLGAGEVARGVLVEEGDAFVLGELEAVGCGGWRGSVQVSGFRDWPRKGAEGA